MFNPIKQCYLPYKHWAFLLYNIHVHILLHLLYPLRALGTGRLLASSNQLVHKTISLFLNTLHEGLTRLHALQALPAMDPSPKEFQVRTDGAMLIGSMQMDMNYICCLCSLKELALHNSGGFNLWTLGNTSGWRCYNSNSDGDNLTVQLTEPLNYFYFRVFI